MWRNLKKSGCDARIVGDVFWRKWKQKSARYTVEDFKEKVEAFGKRFPNQTLLLACLSLGRFTDDALRWKSGTEYWNSKKDWTLLGESLYTNVKRNAIAR